MAPAHAGMMLPVHRLPMEEHNIAALSVELDFLVMQLLIEDR